MRAFTGSVRFSHTPWLRACSPQRRPFSMRQRPGELAVHSGPGSPAAGGALVLALPEGAGGALVLAAAPGRSKLSSKGAVITFCDGVNVGAAGAAACGDAARPASG